LIVVRTDEDDSYVVSDGQVLGGGLSIIYSNIESLSVSSEAGNDLISALWSSPTLITNIVGSLGTDQFVVNWPTVEPIVSKNLRGNRGILEHDISSVDQEYDDLLIEGVAVTVLDNDGLFA
jgi:hypothetical protein